MTIRISKHSPFVLVIWFFCFCFCFCLLVWFDLICFLVSIKLQYRTSVNNHERRFSFDLGIVSHNHDINKGNKEMIWSVNERIETWCSSPNTRESYRIGTKKIPLILFPLIALRSQNCFVPSKHLTDWRKLSNQLYYQGKNEYFDPFIFKASYRAFDLILIWSLWPKSHDVTFQITLS